MQILGIPIGEILGVSTVVVGALWGYAKFKVQMDHLQEDYKESVTGYNKRLEQLETDVKIQSANMSAVSSSLISIQAQLATLTSRLDSIISHLINKER